MVVHRTLFEVEYSLDLVVFDQMWLIAKNKNQLLIFDLETILCLGNLYGNILYSKITVIKRSLHVCVRNSMS